MNTHIGSFFRLAASTGFIVGAISMLGSTELSAETSSKNPASKLYVASLSGDSEINKGDKIEGIKDKAVYNAEGSIIETKPKATDALVYSNGTGLFIAADTRIEVGRFIQEPFTPNRNDLEVEPSISQTEVLVARGAIGLCTSKLVAGSTMKYNTALGSVSIRGGKMVIAAEPDVTKVSLLEGEGLVRGGNLDLGGQVLRPGEQAIIHRGKTPNANTLTIGPIPDSERDSLNDKIFMACAARKTVYFETKGPEGSLTIVAAPVVPPALTPPITISPSQLPP